MLTGGTVTKTPERIEFEWGWAVFSFLLGLVNLTKLQTTAVRELFPAWLVPTWAFLLILSCTLVATGTVYSWRWADRERYFGLHLEAAGLAGQVFGALVWAWASIYVWAHYPEELARPGFPVVSLALVTTWVSINIVRSIRIRSVLGSMAKARQALASVSNEEG